MNLPDIPSGWLPTEKTIHRTFPTGTFKAGVDFITALTPLAETANHHPDIILSYPCVIITLTTHDQGRVTDKDLALTAQINTLWEATFA